MGILDGLEPKTKVSICRVAAIASTLDDKDAKTLLAAAIDINWGYLPLAVALNQRGIILSDKSIKRHRIGLCSCDRVK